MKQFKNQFQLVAMIGLLILISVDQYLKFLAVTYLMPLGSQPVIGEILHLLYIENKGAAFGTFVGNRWILIGLTSLILGTLVVMLLLKKFSSMLMMSAVSLIIAGGTGNLIDRIKQGYVVDFIYVKVINFAVFNFADCCVVAGTMLLLYVIIHQEISAKAKKQKIVPSSESVV